MSWGTSQLNDWRVNGTEFSNVGVLRFLSLQIDEFCAILIRLTPTLCLNTQNPLAKYSLFSNFFLS